MEFNFKKKIYYSSIAITFLVTGCSTIGGGWVESDLKDTVAFDTKCPLEKVQILRHKDEGMSGTGRFEIEACGQNYVYLRFGKSYFEQSKSPLR